MMLVYQVDGRPVMARMYFNPRPPGRYQQIDVVPLFSARERKFGNAFHQAADAARPVQTPRPAQRRWWWGRKKSA